MNDEIKKILEDIDNKECYYVGTNGCLYQDLTKEELLFIKDYITNLQQKYNDNVTKYEELLEKYFNTKHRIDKAISILNKRKEDVEDFSWVEMRRNSYYEECDEVINILQGESNE